MPDVVALFADVVSLLYHEARNVRHLAKEVHAPLDPRFLSLRDGLANNREDAWKQIQPLLLVAARAGSAAEAEMLFRKRFGIGLDDLVSLYAHPGWRGSPYGGNAWLPIARRAIELRDMVDAGKGKEARQLVAQILESSHNTGKIGQKLKNLNESLLRASPTRP